MSEIEGCLVTTGNENQNVFQQWNSLEKGLTILFVEILKTI